MFHLPCERGHASLAHVPAARDMANGLHLTCAAVVASSVREWLSRPGDADSSSYLGSYAHASRMYSAAYSSQYSDAPVRAGAGRGEVGEDTHRPPRGPPAQLCNWAPSPGTGEFATTHLHLVRLAEVAHRRCKRAHGVTCPSRTRA